jgi:hypothetical protein
LFSHIVCELVNRNGRLSDNILNIANHYNIKIDSSFLNHYKLSDDKVASYQIKYSIDDIPSKYRNMFSSKYTYIELIVALYDKDYPKSGGQFYDEDIIGKNSEMTFYIGTICDYAIGKFIDPHKIYYIEAVIKHELTHFIQHRCFKSRSLSQIDTGDSDDYSSYTTSNIEFDPIIKTEIGKFVSSHYPYLSDKDLRFLVRDYLKHSSFFKTLKHTDQDKWEKASREFYRRLEDIYTSRRKRKPT